MSPIVGSAVAVLIACLLAAAPPAAALPNPGPIAFVGPTPAAGASVVFSVSMQWRSWFDGVGTPR